MDKAITGDWTTAIQAMGIAFVLLNGLAASALFWMWAFTVVLK